MNVIQEFTEWRHIKKFSYAEAGRQIDVDKGTLRQIERGERKCPPVVFGKMVKITLSQNGGNKQS